LLDNTILPGLWRIEPHDFGFQLRTPLTDRVAVLAEVRFAIPVDFQIRYRVVTETSRGESQAARLAALPGFERFIQSLSI
jgi:hypothetical protein